MESTKENIDLIGSDAGAGLIIIKSKIPVIRAGYGNIIVLLVLCIVFLVDEILVRLGAAEIFRYLIFGAEMLLFLGTYSSSVSRISLYDEAADIVCSLKSYTIRYSNLSHVKIYILPSCMLTVMVLRFKDRYRFRVFHYVATSTNRGSVDDSAKYLRQMIENKITSTRSQTG